MKIAKDKLAHFMMGAVVSLPIAIATGHPEYGIAAAIAVGAAKEIYDKVSGKGTPEVMDFVATGLGSVVVLPLFII